MRAILIQLIQRGGMVTFPFKTEPQQWLGEAKLYHCFDVFGQKNAFFMQWPKGLSEFPNAEEAVDAYLRTVFNRNNLGIALDGIQRHNLTVGFALDDFTEQELKAKTDCYFEEFFLKDYPFAASF